MKRQHLEAIIFSLIVESDLISEAWRFYFVRPNLTPL